METSAAPEAVPRQQTQTTPRGSWWRRLGDPASSYGRQQSNSHQKASQASCVRLPSVIVSCRRRLVFLYMSRRLHKAFRYKKRKTRRSFRRGQQYRAPSRSLRGKGDEGNGLPSASGRRPGAICVGCHARPLPIPAQNLAVQPRLRFSAASVRAYSRPPALQATDRRTRSSALATDCVIRPSRSTSAPPPAAATVKSPQRATGFCRPRLADL